MATETDIKTVPHMNGSILVEEDSRDNVTLERLGKKPVLKRNFGFLTILGFSCTVLITWEGSLIGGPSGLVYGYLIVWAGTLSVSAVLSELVSMAPTSGGQYHWVSMLAPPSSRKFSGYITGWLTIAGWQATVASGLLLNGTLIQAIILLTHPGYADNMQIWHGTLLSWAVALLSFTINTSIGSVLAKFEIVVLFLHVLGFFAVLIPIVTLGDHTSARDVFKTFLNGGECQTQGLSFSIGISGLRLSEETHNAPVVIPQSIMTGLTINACLGFAMVAATLFSMGDIDAAMAENPRYPFMAIFQHAIGSTTGAAVMSSLVVVMCFSALTGVLASTSRIYWAFARDRGLPGWRTLNKVNERTKIPFNSVLLATGIAIVLSLINIGDETAFNGVISISIAGIFGSYMMAASWLLYCRLAGKIREPNNDDEITNTIGKSLTWGPWRIRGFLGVANNIFTCVYLIYVFFFSFWPSSIEVSAAIFNWAVVPFSAVIIWCLLYYAIWGRKTYLGPIIEL
ncbi:amino acid/polyamine transporter I [Apiospora saccharicola]